MLWFNFILGLNFIFLCFKLIIMHYLTQKQWKIKFKPRMKLNHNTYHIKYLSYWQTDRVTAATTTSTSLSLIDGFIMLTLWK